MSQQFLLSFKKDVSFAEPEETKDFVLRAPNRSMTFKQVQPGFKIALQALASGGATLAELSQIVQNDDGDFPALIYAYLQKFSSLGWLCRSVVAEGKVIAIAIPLTSDCQFPDIEVAVDSVYRLSQFAYCHQVEGQLLLESPLSSMQVRLMDWKGAALLSQLARSCSCRELMNTVPGISIELAKQFINLLLSTQMLDQVCKSTIQEQANLSLAQWESHDLLSYARSREARHSNAFEGTYRFLNQIEPHMSEKTIELYKPDLRTLAMTETSFTQVLEVRKSIQQYGNPLSAQQLGEFLYRTARVKDVFQTEHGEVSYHPYPNEGALYELELYSIVNRCDGIPSGFYHYEPLSHQLWWISDKTEPVEALLSDAWQSMRRQGMSQVPQVLIVIAARFQRLAWKYEPMAYALMLKHVGVLHQTMYLTATAMNLASCGLGGGNSDSFTKAAGCDYDAETPVGEFALGSQPNF
ncbi:SagB family peptide dehydrogenase [Leptolyngbya sp. NIES-2104]|uniref:SagB family peptide dehydrogenase n=1 Tax=Leptolyngbya sp. NIES-2104 TaxID=1552121 RepID=UPI0006EC67E7|nr:SagB family peptide dehydrogenase [Leptolyngbya sp. NIES-2104]GAP94234.1 TOMM biosynthesis dehydrogenase [Leptolyngbya sp. NIES-2104]